MKCEECRKRMKTVLGNAEVKIEGKPIKILNMPILVCPDCGKQVIHDVLIARAKNYVHQYGAQNDSIDFGECEQKEGEDTITVMQTLGLL